MRTSGQTNARVAILVWMVGVAIAGGGVFDFGERPLGTEANQQMVEFLRSASERMGYEVQSLPFKCVRWSGGPSYVDRGGTRVEVFPGPFSRPFDKLCDAVAVSTTSQLKRTRCEDRILFLRGEIAKEPLMPPGHPFYSPDAHKEIYALLDERRPAAVLAITGRHPSNGLEPFPLFDDPSFRIPTAYMGEPEVEAILAAKGKIRLKIDSKTFPATGEQIVAIKRAAGESKGKIVLFAHMDSAYGTPGVLANATGLAVLLRAMVHLKDYAGPYDLEFIPFNGEDSPMVKGQVAYLEQFGGEMDDVRLAINVDGVGARDSKTAVSAYNLEPERQSWLDAGLGKYGRIERGPEWVESDHSIFVFRGVPCLALTSSTLREHVMAVSHTPRDTLEEVDLSLLVEAADFIANLVQNY